MPLRIYLKEHQVRIKENNYSKPSRKGKRVAIKEVDSKVEAVNQDLQKLKEDMPIFGIEEGKITTTIKRKGVKCLGGKESNAYKDRSIRGKLYSDLYHELKR